MMTYESSPMEVDKKHKDYILHSTLTFDYALIMAADQTPDRPVTQGDNAQISIVIDNLKKHKILTQI